MPVIGGQGILQEAHDGQGTHAAGHGRNPTALLVHLVVLHVADDAVAGLLRGVGHTVDTHVDHHSARLHHVGRNELRLADGHHQYVGLQAQLLEVLRAAVAHGNGTVEALAAQ